MSKNSNLPAPMKPWASPEGHGAHYINVEWAMPPASIPAAEFECQYGFRLLGKWFTHARGLTDDPAMETRRVEPLKPNEKYIVRVRARFAGQGWGPWSPKSEVLATLPEGAKEGSSPRMAGFEGDDPALKQFQGIDDSKLKSRYEVVWKHKVAAHRGDPTGASTLYKLPAILSVNQYGVAMSLRQTGTISAQFDIESIKTYRCRGSGLFTIVVGMLNDANASATMWAHGMDALGGEAPYLFEYEFETRDGKLIGAAIIKATKEARLAEQDRMRQLMFDSQPKTMADAAPSWQARGKQ
jgi:hypothetical protein